MQRTVLLLSLCLGTSLVMAQSNQDYGTYREGTQKITNGPVVEYVSDQSAMIAWSTKLPAGTYLAYGTDPNNLNQRSQRAWGGTNHRLKLENLQADTTYFFQVRSENAKGTGDDVQSPVASFKTVAKGASPERENRNVGINSGTSAGAATSASNADVDYVPLYRMYGQGNHFYTTDPAEQASAIRAGGYKSEGITGYLATRETAETTELYHLQSNRGSAVDHLYTTSEGERQSAMQQGYQAEGVAGYIAKSQMPGTAPLYRLVSDQGTHFYTTSESERDAAVTKGYRAEGVAGYVWTEPPR